MYWGNIYFFPIYYVAFIDVLIDIEKYWQIIIRGRIFKICKRKNIYFWSLIISIYWYIVKYWKILKKYWRVSILNVFKVVHQILQNYHRYIFFQYFIIQGVQLKWSVRDVVFKWIKLSWITFLLILFLLSKLMMIMNLLLIVLEQPISRLISLKYKFTKIIALKKKQTFNLDSCK
jgi:hypothetical protein